MRLQKIVEIDLGDAITLLGHLFLGGPTRLLPFCASPVPVPGLPATGKKTCYDRAGAETACNDAACPGQDGAYSTGCPPQGRFADGGDGTVLDTCTGLVWQKRPGAENRTWCDALAYCDAGGKCTPGIPQCMDPGSCMNAMDCGTPPPDCKPCGGGTCAQFQCLENKCVFGCLPNPEPQCKTSDECPVIGDICYPCPTTMNCAVQACLQGSCELVCPVE